jgi:hypothetical protein
MSNLTTHLCKHVSAIAFPLTFLYTISSLFALLSAKKVPAKDPSNSKVTRNSTWPPTEKRQTGKNNSVIFYPGQEPTCLRVPGPNPLGRANTTGAPSSAVRRATAAPQTSRSISDYIPVRDHSSVICAPRELFQQKVIWSSTSSAYTLAANSPSTWT